MSIAVRHVVEAFGVFYDGLYDRDFRKSYRFHECLGEALVTLANAPHQPVRWAAGSDALRLVQGKVDSLQAELDAWRDLTVSTDGDFEFRPEAAAGAWA